MLKKKRRHFKYALVCQNNMGWAFSKRFLYKKQTLNTLNTKSICTRLIMLPYFWIYSDIKFYGNLVTLQWQARNQEFFRAGEFSWN